MREPTKIFEDVLSLPSEERARPAAKLIESLDPETEDRVEDTWRAEVARRVRELDEGTVETVDWVEARRRIIG